MNILLNPNFNRLLATLDDNTSMASVVLRDGVDNMGRAVMAYKRDPNDGRERLIEENLTTLIWGFGIRFMKNRVYDPIARRLGLPYPSFHMSLLKDGPQKLTPEIVTKYAPHDRHLLDLVSKPALQQLYHKSNVAKFLIATGIPILLIAFGIPTINQRITRKKLEKEKRERTADPARRSPQFGAPGPAFSWQASAIQRRPRLYQAFESGLPAAAGRSAFQTHRPQGLRFGGITDKLATGISGILQHERANNLIVDGTISSGRTIKARNMYERLEVIFQEASVIFFLYFAQNLIQRAVEKLIDRGLGIVSGMGFKEMKFLRDTYGDDAARFLAEKNRSIEPFRQWLGQKAMPEAFEEALVPRVRDYVAQGGTDNLLFNIGRNAGKIPVIQNGAGQIMPDLTRTIQADDLFKLAGQLDNLALQAQGRSLAKLLSRSMMGKFGAFVLSSAICTAFLGYLIPKTKQAITVKLTGKNQFPGTMGL